MGQATDIDPPLRCSFCNKAQSEVRKLIAGPNALICDECVQVFKKIVTTPDEQATPVDAALPKPREDT
jgi:ATP-dependent Clp protease ATP-binding subunit ClpX